MSHCLDLNWCIRESIWRIDQKVKYLIILEYFTIHEANFTSKVDSTWYCFDWPMNFFSQYIWLPSNVHYCESFHPVWCYRDTVIFALCINQDDYCHSPVRPLETPTHFQIYISGSVVCEQADPISHFYHPQNVCLQNLTKTKQSRETLGL